MENVKVLISGPFKEKAMLLSVIGDALEANGIPVVYKDKAVDQMVRDHCGNVCDEQIRELLPNITLELENLHNTNVVEDLTKLYNTIGNKSKADNTDTVSSILKEIRKILLIE